MGEVKQGRIVKVLSGFYYVDDDALECRARGKLRLNDSAPVTGDLVHYTVQDGRGVILEILPRKNCFLRPAVANLDAIVIFASGVIPITDPYLIDRITAIAAGQNVESIICINKTDLDPGEDLADIYRSAGFSVVRTSAETGEGVDQLKALIRGKTTAFTGNSGVGKSSILNRLSPKLSLETGEVSQKLGRGRHTTRCVSLYPLGEQTYVADTPGFSSFDTTQLEPIKKEELQYAFPEFSPCLGTCQFHDCAHLKEPGCGITAAVAAGRIPKSRYESYVLLYELAKQIKPWENK